MGRGMEGEGRQGKERDGTGGEAEAGVRKSRGGGEMRLGVSLPKLGTIKPPILYSLHVEPGRSSSAARPRLLLITDHQPLF